MNNLPRILIYVAGLLILIFSTRLLPETGYAVWLRLCSTAYFAFIICDQCFNEQAVLKFGNNAFLSKWGKYTYGMYLLHPLVHSYVLKWAGPVFDSTGTFSKLYLLAGASLIFTHLVCYLSYTYFESPFLKLKRKFSHLQTT